MTPRIPPRSPRETMDGWHHLPRYIDKIRLHLAGRLHAEYQDNLGKGFDGLWLEAAALSHDQMIEVVRDRPTDGEVYDWIRARVQVPAEAKEAHWARMLNYPRADDPTGQERLALRKSQSGLSHRQDITCFVDYIDADEGRL